MKKTSAVLSAKLAGVFPITADISRDDTLEREADELYQLPRREQVRKLQPIIDKALSAYAGGNSSPVVRDRARLMAARAIDSYDPARGAKLETHVFNQLRSLQRDVPKMSDPMPMPERFAVDNANIYRIKQEIENDEGREALPEEIADRLHMPMKRVNRVLNRSAGRLTYSEYEGADSDEDEAKDVVTNESTPWDEWVDMVYHDLSPRDRIIFRHRSGYMGSPVLDTNAIAEQLGVTPQVVSQRARAIQKHLDRFA